MDTPNDNLDNNIFLLAALVVVIVYSASDIPRAHPYRPSVDIPLESFELDKLDDKYYRRLIRFTKEEIRILIIAL